MSDLMPNFWREDTHPEEVNFEGLVRLTDESISKATAYLRPTPISVEEWNTARMGPAAIIDEWIYEDVGMLVAPGGTGKTTLVLFQAIHIVLELNWFGSEVLRPGPVVILTAEDDRESLIGRLRAICLQMQLSTEEVTTVRASVLIADVSGRHFKLTEVANHVVRSSNGTERLIQAILAIRPVVLFIDPAVSFGIGEQRVNDAEQGLIEVARRIRNEVSCAVVYVHHTGKGSAKDQSISQYASRGGSAFADGSRMVHVLQPLDSGQWLKATGDVLQEGEVGLILARPKISHAPPQPSIYLKRTGYIFARYGVTADKNSALAANAERVLEVIRGELSAGRLPTGRSLEAMETGLKQRALRDAIAWLKASGRIAEMPNPNSKGRGGSRSYLNPTADMNGFDA